MYFENYGHIISPNEIKVVNWDLVSKRERVDKYNYKRTDINGSPEATIKIGYDEYFIKGWRLIHRLFKEFDPFYTLTIPELKSLAFELLIEEGIYFYNFINGMLSDADTSKKYLIGLEGNSVVSIQHHPSPSPDNIFHTIKDMIQGDWEYETVYTPHRTVLRTDKVRTIILKKHNEHGLIYVMMKTLTNKYLITCGLNKNKVTLRPKKMVVVDKKKGFEEKVVQTIQNFTDTLIECCGSYYSFWHTNDHSYREGRMTDFERDQLEHELFLSTLYDFKKN